MPIGTRTFRVLLEVVIEDMSLAERVELGDESNPNPEAEPVILTGGEVGAAVEGSVEDINVEDLVDPIYAALDSRNNPEIFAGTGIFVHFKEAKVKAIDWVDGLNVPTGLGPDNEVLNSAAEDNDQ